jgi:hypothetical protein
MTRRSARLLLTTLALGLTASVLGVVPSAGAGTSGPAAVPARGDLFDPLSRL